MATSLLSAQYEFNGVVSTDKSVLKNLQDMCTACGSWLTYDIHEGKWAVVINTTGSSVASFDDSNIIGAITVQGTGLDQLTDHCIVNFPHTDINDNRDFIRIDTADEDRFPNEISRPVTIETDLFNDPVQAQLLGLIELKQRRIDRVIRFTTDFSMIGLKAGDLIDVTNSVYAYTAKMFRIISINEADADNGSINLDITALEYDEAVYDTADLERYTITNETGIVSLGNISAPGTPTVTKHEFDARPRLIIQSTVPIYGSVTGMEYWYSEDVGVALDVNRTYKLLGTAYANANTVLTPGETVTTDQDSLGNISLYVKTRGINAQTAGPFSSVSGSVTNFAPVQTTDAISDTTQVSNTGTGSLLSALALTTLLKNLDGLFNANTSISQAGGGLFDKMFKTFKANSSTFSNVMTKGDNYPQFDTFQITSSTSTVQSTYRTLAGTATLSGGYAYAGFPSDPAIGDCVGISFAIGATVNTLLFIIQPPLATMKYEVNTPTTVDLGTGAINDNKIIRSGFVAYAPSLIRTYFGNTQIQSNTTDWQTGSIVVQINAAAPGTYTMYFSPLLTYELNHKAQYQLYMYDYTVQAQASGGGITVTGYAFY